MSLAVIQFTEKYWHIKLDFLLSSCWLLTWCLQFCPIWRLQLLVLTKTSSLDIQYFMVFSGSRVACWKVARYLVHA